MKLLIINGPNMNLLGVREPEIFGTRTYEELVDFIREERGADNELKFIQTNHEGDIIDEIHQAFFENYDGIVINHNQQKLNVSVDGVTDGYIRGDNTYVMLEGRSFTKDDEKGQRHSCIVSDVFVKQYFGRENANAVGCDSTVILHLSIDEGLSTGIHGQSTISPATNLIMGVYTYYIDSTNIDPSNVRWSLDRPDWRITPHGASCRVTCLSEGEAKLRAWTENEFCDIDTTLILLGRFFDVDENDEPELSVYPNPTRGQVTVSWHEIEEVNVIDMLGQRLVSYKLGRVESCELNIRDYAHGVYMLEIISSSGTAYRPVVRGLY